MRVINSKFLIVMIKGALEEDGMIKDHMDGMDCFVCKAIHSEEIVLRSLGHGDVLHLLQAMSASLLCS